jgi:hypothetical protein
MNAVQLGFPKAVAEAHGSRPKTYANSYAMVQSIEQKLRGSGPEINYHAEKQRDMMNQMMNKFKDAKQIQTYQLQNGTSVRTIPYDGPKTSMPFNMVTVCNDKPFSGSGLRYENQKLGKDLLAKRAKQLGEQQMAVEGSVVPTTAEMERRMMGPTDAELEKIITAPSELAMDEILSNYEFLLDGLEEGLVGAGSFDYVRKIAFLIKKHSSILSRSNFNKLIDLTQDALEYARTIISKKVGDEFTKFRASEPASTIESFVQQRRATETIIESALERIQELLVRLSDVADFASDKERKQAIASTLRDAGLEALKEPSMKRKEARTKRRTKYVVDELAERMKQANITDPFASTFVPQYQ